MTGGSKIPSTIVAFDSQIQDEPLSSSSAVRYGHGSMVIEFAARTAVTTPTPTSHKMERV